MRGHGPSAIAEGMGKNPIRDPGTIEPIDLSTALEERYLAYALSTITQRALPDARDGLKPVHRRLVYAMRELRLNPGQGFKKSARVVGDVIGKFHPHGDQSVYDALVRLAQDFAVRYPLVEGQGNFGNVDGDNAAAMRYTEARMTDVAMRLLEAIDEEAVDFRETYDGSEKEPVVLPAAFPNLLANGSSGIAVGMATSVPPHNVSELCEAARLLLKDPQTPVETLLTAVRGPDFPTGGVLVDPTESFAEAYRTGRGGFRLRARWEREETGRGTYVVVVTEIPYLVQKSRLIEKIAELLAARKLPMLADVRDESAEDIRVVLEPKSRSVDPALLMEQLFRVTDLESRIPLNMNVLSGGRVPKVMGLSEVLLEWLGHRFEVLRRVSGYRLGKIEDRLEILGGLLVAYLNLDEVIAIIRNEDEPKPVLIRRFDLTDRQAEAILNMRLRSLRKLEEIEIARERDTLETERKRLEELLGSQGLQRRAIDGELKDLIKAFGPDTALGRRRTGFGDAPAHDVADIEKAMIEREAITVIVSAKGWVRALKGHADDTSSLTFKQDDSLKFALKAETTDELLLFSTGGKVFTLSANALPGGRGHGEPLRLMVDLEEGQDIVGLRVFRPEGKLLLAAASGRGFVVPEKEIVARTRKGKQVLGVDGGDELARIAEAEGDTVAIVGRNRKLLVFPLDQLPEMTRGKGVRLQRYKDGGIADVKVFKGADGLTWTDSAGRQYTRSLDDLAEWCSDRASAGRMAPQGFPRTNRFGG